MAKGKLCFTNFLGHNIFHFFINEELSLRITNKTIKFSDAYRFDSFLKTFWKIYHNGEKVQ